MKTSKEVTEALKNHRQSIGLSQSKLSEKVGCSIPTLISIESGKSDPKIGQLWSISNALGLTMSIQIIDPEDESPNEVIEH